MNTGFRRQETGLITEKFKGFFAGGASQQTGKQKLWRGEKSWLQRCKYYDAIYERHPLAKAQILTIAGQFMAEGVFTTPTERDGNPYPRSEEAKLKCDDLNEQIGLDTMLYETAANMAKYGSCFWEKTTTPSWDVRLIPYQQGIEAAMIDDVGNVTYWRQVVNGKQTALWASQEICHFEWNPTTSSWPYGTSLLVGLDTEFATLEQLEYDVKEYMHKNAFPKELWQVGNGQFMPSIGEISNIRSKVKNWEPGEHFVTSYPIAREAGGTGDRKIESLHEVLNYLKDQCIDGLMVPPISRQWSSTEASAKEMMPWARANLIVPMQRLSKRIIEREVYRPYLEDVGFSVKTCPTLSFQPPDAHKDEDAEYYSKGVLAGYFPPKWVAKRLGVPEEEWDEWQKEEEQREEKQLERDKAAFNAKGSAVKGEGSEEEKTPPNA